MRHIRGVFLYTFGNRYIEIISLYRVDLRLTVRRFGVCLDVVFQREQIVEKGRALRAEPATRYRISESVGERFFEEQLSGLVVVGGFAPYVDREEMIGSKERLADTP